MTEQHFRMILAATALVFGVTSLVMLWFRRREDKALQQELEDIRRDLERAKRDLDDEIARIKYDR